MDKVIREIVTCLLQEVRKDLWFFTSCGAFVGLLMIWQFRLKEIGIANGESWPDALFEDFISFNAFWFIFIGLMGVGAIATILSALGLTWHRLEAAITHLESRLVQIASVIISFTLGVSVSALLHSLFTVTASGAILAVMTVPFNAVLFIGLFSSALVARRVEPFNRWWVSLLVLLFALGSVAWSIIRGIN